MALAKINLYIHMYFKYEHIGHSSVQLPPVQLRHDVGAVPSAV